MTDLAGLDQKYMTVVIKKLKEQKKKHVIKRRLKFEDYKISLQNSKTILRLQQRFKSEASV